MGEEWPRHMIQCIYKRSYLRTFIGVLEDCVLTCWILCTCTYVHVNIHTVMFLCIRVLVVAPRSLHYTQAHTIPSLAACAGRSCRVGMGE